MKQKLHQSLLVTLVTKLLAIAGFSASAQEDYNLVIASVAVTSASYKHLSGIEGVYIISGRKVMHVQR